MSSFDLLNTTNGGEGIIPFADRLESRLTSQGAINLLGVALYVAPAWEAVHLCDTFLNYYSAGYPTPYLEEVADEAKWHASIASPSERIAYCVAHFQHMEPKDQSDFLAGISQERRAA